MNKKEKKIVSKWIEIRGSKDFVNTAHKKIGKLLQEDYDLIYRGPEGENILIEEEYRDMPIMVKV